MFDIDKKLDALQKEQEITLGPNFWDQPKEAEKVLASIKAKKVWTDDYQRVSSVIDDTGVMFEFFQSGDATEAEMQEQFNLAVKAVEDLEFKNMLSAEEDQLNAVLQITAGAG
ncbi:MAG TPA: PCRF domain-containing protein, partial [Mucilaginibacter sp.]|nr:PCRF domain-containing protein [Mucilaginibacter sp.]